MTNMYFLPTANTLFFNSTYFLVLTVKNINTWEAHSGRWNHEEKAKQNNNPAIIASDFIWEIQMVVIHDKIELVTHKQSFSGNTYI